jgi:hypothetical protein
MMSTLAEKSTEAPTAEVRERSVLDDAALGHSAHPQPRKDSPTNGLTIFSVIRPCTIDAVDQPRVTPS